MKKRLLYILSGLSILMLLGCTTLTLINPWKADVPQQKLNVPMGNYRDVIQFPNGKMLIAEGKTDTGNILHYYDLHENHFVEIPTPQDERCQGTQYDFPTALPDNRLGFNLSCYVRWPDRPIGKRAASYIVAYDWDTDKFEQLVEEPLSSESWQVTWNPEMSRGVQGIGRLVGTIYWLNPQGMEPMTFTLGIGKKSWALDENFAAMENPDLRDVGIARSPTWSPDGQHIAFLASVDAIGREGFARARASYDLYLLNPLTLQLTKTIGNMTNTKPLKSLIWSPDSQWLLISGQLNGTNGLWLTSLDGQTLALVDGTGHFEGQEWLDNRTILATKCVNSDLPCSQSDVIQYDVSQIIQAN